jgi:hypothetical protein
MICRGPAACCSRSAPSMQSPGTENLNREGGICWLLALAYDGGMYRHHGEVRMVGGLTMVVFQEQ